MRFVPGGWDLCEPSAPTIEVSAGSRYHPLVIQMTGDLNLSVLKYAEDGADQYVIVFGNDMIRLPLRKGTPTLGHASLLLNANAVASLTDMVLREAGQEPSQQDCKDVVIRYRVYARRFEGEWAEVMHGPVTFRCDPRDVAPVSGNWKSSSVDNGDGGVGEGGAFDGSYSPAYMANRSTQG